VVMVRAMMIKAKIIARMADPLPRVHAAALFGDMTRMTLGVGWLARQDGRGEHDQLLMAYLLISYG